MGTSFSDDQPDGSVPARIIKIDPEGIVEVPDRSVGFEFECKVNSDANPPPRITWATGWSLIHEI